MSTQLDNLNTEVATLTTVANEVLNVVKNNPAQAELDATNTGVDAATAAVKAVVDSLSAVLPPAPAPAPAA